MSEQRLVDRLPSIHRDGDRGLPQGKSHHRLLLVLADLVRLEGIVLFIVACFAACAPWATYESEDAQLDSSEKLIVSTGLVIFAVILLLVFIRGSETLRNDGRRTRLGWLVLGLVGAVNFVPVGLVAL